MAAIVDLESSSIGAALLNAEAAALVFGDLHQTDFENGALGELFSQLQSLWQQHGKLDAALASTVPGKQLALQCAESTPSISKSNVGIWVRTISERAAARRAQSIALAMASGDATLEELQVQGAELMQVLSGKNQAEWTNLGDAFVDFYARQRGEKPVYIKCGYPTLDKYTYLEPGDMVIIGARPSDGKTMSSLNLAIGWAQHGYKVAYYSLETSGRKLFDRLLASWAGLPLGEIKRGEVPTDDAELMEDCRSFCQLPIMLCDAAGRTVSWMRAQAARVGAQIAVVDYLQIVDGPGKSPYETVTGVSKALHTWAQADKVMVVALSQLSRSGAGGSPKLTDLRESGQVEQDADLILLLSRKVDADTGETDDYIWDIAKNKEGQVGAIHMSWDGEHQRVREIAIEPGGEG